MHKPPPQSSNRFSSIISIYYIGISWLDEQEFLTKSLSHPFTFYLWLPLFIFYLSQPKVFFHSSRKDTHILSEKNRYSPSLAIGKNNNPKQNQKLYSSLKSRKRYEQKMNPFCRMDNFPNYSYALDSRWPCFFPPPTRYICFFFKAFGCRNTPKNDGFPSSELPGSRIFRCKQGSIHNTNPKNAHAFFFGNPSQNVPANICFNLWVGI